MAKFCEKCGTRVEDDMPFCPNCGNRLETPQPEPPEVPEIPETSETPEAVPVPEPRPFAEAAPAYEAPAVAEKKRSPGKVIAICLAVILVLGAVGFGAWKLLGSRTRENPLETAARAASTALTDELRQLPNLSKMLDVLEEINNTGKLEIQFNLEGDVEEVAFSTALTERIDQQDGRFRADASIQSESLLNKPLDITVYADRQQAQLSSETLLEEDVFSLPLENLGKQWNASKLSEMVDAKLPEDLSVNLFPERYDGADLDQMMETVFGEDWTRFRETVETVPVTENPHFGEGVTYKLTWDADRFKPIYEASLDTADPVEMNLSNLFAELSSLGAKTVVRVLGDTEMQFRVEKDLLTGVWFKNEEQETEIRLEGGEQPWSKICLDHHQKGEDYVKADLLLTVAEGKLTLVLKDRDQETAQLKLVYDDADGSLSLLTDEDKSLLEELPGGSMTMKLQPDGDRIRCTGRVSILEEDQGYFDIQAQVSALKEPITIPSESPRALLEMSESRIEGVLMKIMLKARSLLKPEILEGLMP